MTVPRELAPIEALVNTVELDTGEEQLSSPAALRDWLAGQGLLDASAVVGDTDLAVAIELREALRAMLRVNDGAPVDPAAVEAAITPATKAILPVHIFGYPAELAERMDVVLAATQRALRQVPAEHLGMKYPGRDRTVRQLGFHVFRLSLAFREAMEARRLPKAWLDEDAPAERLPRLEVEPDRNDAELARPLGLVAERQARGAGLDALHAPLGVRGALGIDGDQPAVAEGLEACREGAEVLVHFVWVVLLAVHRDRPARVEKPSGEGVAEERRRREVVDLPPERAAHQQRVDEIVGMVDAKEYRPDGGHALGVPHVHRAEKEPEPEAPNGAHGAIEAVHRVAPHPGVEGRAHGISRWAKRFTNSSKSLTASASAHAAPSESRP